jgi:hypothetical protein
MSKFNWDGTGSARGFWTNWDEDEVNEMQAELATIEHLEHLKYEVGHLKTLVRDTSTGHIRTAISVLEDRIKELTPKPEPKRVFEVEVVKRDGYAYASQKKQFESADEAWKFYDEVLDDPYWLAHEPLVIRK